MLRLPHMERQLRMRAIYWVQSDPNRPLRLSSETLEKVQSCLCIKNCLL